MPSAPTAFDHLPADSSRTVSWIHIGDTHLTQPGEQNDLDLGRIVDEINQVYAGGGVDFVFVPGDIAEHGSALAYDVFRSHLDRLKLPWCAIVGDHDVQPNSFAPFRQHVSSDLTGAFSIGDYRFLRLNAFSLPRPDSFVVDEPQLTWLEHELALCQVSARKAVLFLHCYPSDLSQGGAKLAELLRQYPVLLVEMGHTHYNEISNDGRVLYAATRSTGQVEEGPVGYSLTTLDQSCVSWEFVPLGSPSLVAITYPPDHRLGTERTASTPHPAHFEVRAKTFSANPIVRVHATIAGSSVPLESHNGINWKGEVNASHVGKGLHRLDVIAEDAKGMTLNNSIRIVIGPPAPRSFHAVDQDNAIGEWPERGILGTQLGPNKNGRTW